MNIIEIRVDLESFLEALESDGHIWEDWRGVSVQTPRRPFHIVVEWQSGIDVRGVS